METKADLILHPVRMRIIRSFRAGTSLTAQQIAAALPEVPQATLYRHLNRLVAGGILGVVEQRRVRGTVEKRYALAADAANLTPEDLATTGKDDHMRYFTTFVATLLGDFARYLEQDHIDLLADGVGYHQVALYLSDQELMQLATALNAAVAPVLHNEPAPGRRLRIFSSVLVPASVGSTRTTAFPQWGDPGEPGDRR